MTVRAAHSATFLLASALLSAAFLRAQPAPVPVTAPAPVTLAIFPDHPLTARQWQDIAFALQSEANSAFQPATQPGSTAAIPSPQILRGDAITPGIVVQSNISIYLHGDCAFPTYPSPSRQPLIHGPLGWVILRNGQIEPFIHVDCNLLRQLLVRRVPFLTQDQRRLAMPTAIARVLLHEWVHIAAQSPSHTKHGLTKAEFSLDDLLAPLRPAIAESQTVPGHPGAPR